MHAAKIATLKNDRQLGKRLPKYDLAAPLGTFQPPGTCLRQGHRIAENRSPSGALRDAGLTEDWPTAVPSNSSVAEDPAGPKARFQ